MREKGRACQSHMLDGLVSLQCEVKVKEVCSARVSETVSLLGKAKDLRKDLTMVEKQEC